MNEIKLVTRQKYGNWLIYPACNTSQLLLGLTGRLTFRADHLPIIEALGFTITFISDTAHMEELKKHLTKENK